MTSGEELIELFLNSERTTSELEMRLELQLEPLEVAFYLREWIEFDPAYEFRAFVSNHKLTGLTQMATMDVMLHYPQLETEKKFLEENAKQFIAETVLPKIENITNNGPSKQIVLDIYYHKSANRWYVVEINPFLTSSSGHLFNYCRDEDNRVLLYGPFEFRLSNKTKAEDLIDIPEEWREKIKAKDTFDVTEEEYNNASKSGEKKQSNESSSNPNEASDVDVDLRTLLKSGEHSDCKIILGKRTYHLHKNALTKYQYFADQLANSSTINLGNKSISENDFQLILEFIYAGDKANSGWDCPDWNELFISVMELEIDELLEKFIHWRESQSSAESKSQAESEEFEYDESIHTLPGWKAQKQPGGIETGAKRSDLVSYALEIEGNSLIILNYYRPEYIDEPQWNKLTLKEKGKVINNNWAKLKKKIENPKNANQNAVYWMNKNLTIEDSGFLWEVSFGGDSLGYTNDLEELLEQYYLAIENGLGVADRQMDSAFQFHIAFPFFEESDAPVRRDVLSFMIHLDDFCFFNHFSRYIYDDCNNVWTDEDIANLLATVDENDKEKFETYISHKGMPNPAVKHKHIGLRGKDTYKADCRYGFEIRRGFDTEEMEGIIRYISEILSNIGCQSSQFLPIRFNWLRKSKRDYYYLSDVIRFITSSHRVCPHNGILPAPTSEEDATIDLDKLDSLTETWLNQFVEWEAHLIRTKNILWSNKLLSDKSVDDEFTEQARTKLRRRMALLLLTDWRQFPASTSAQQKDILQSLFEEQAFIRHRINTQLLGLKARAELTTRPDSDAKIKLLTDNVYLTDIRDVIIDFAVRIGRLY